MSIASKRGMAALAVASIIWGSLAQAASHREAPLIAQDPTADITDTYLFRSWESGHSDKVVMIMNVIPGQEPGSGPNYFNFGDDVLYSFNFDVNGDGKANDIVYEVRFTTENRGALKDLKLPLPVVAVPPVTALDGAGSDGLTFRQRYSVTKVQGGVRTNLGSAPMYAVPSNMGPLTMPDYEALAASGIYNIGGGGRVFAGQRDETFYIDLGAVFDTVNHRTGGVSRPFPILSGSEDNNDSANPFGNDTFSGVNVNTIAIEVPISELTSDPNATIGMYASTSRQKFKVLSSSGVPVSSGPFVQVARMANPLINELIIGTVDKDRWNALDPRFESVFLDYYLNSRLGTALNIRYDLPALNLGIPTTNRTDLVNVLLKYGSQPQTGACAPASPCSELLRLNVGVAPTDAAAQKRLTVLMGDNAGWPNGRRPNDDVTDIALRVVAGALIGSAIGGQKLGDGVNYNSGAAGGAVTATGVSTAFPFLPTPHDGRNRRHVDCGEADANPCD